MAPPVKWTEQRRRDFLAGLRETGNVTAAVARCGLSRRSAYTRRSVDADFRAAWDEAVESAMDDLEAELRRRAMEGTERPVFYGGKPVGTIRNYSDSLAMFLLRSRRPHVFGGRKAQAEAGASEDAGSVRRRLEEKLAGLEAAADGGKPKG